MILDIFEWKDRGLISWSHGENFMKHEFNDLSPKFIDIMKYV